MEHNEPEVRKPELTLTTRSVCKQMLIQFKSAELGRKVEIEKSTVIIYLDTAKEIIAIEIFGEWNMDK